jgi:hypothetical protein
MLKKGWYRTRDGHRVKVPRDMPHGMVVVTGIGLVGYYGDGKRQIESAPAGLDLVMESWYPLPINVEAFVDVVIHAASDEQLEEMICYAKESSEEHQCLLCHEPEHSDECPITLLEAHIEAYRKEIEPSRSPGRKEE